MKVLVVDDDYAVLDAIKDVLEDEGYEVTLAANGLEALKELRRGDRPCLILLDLMMPVMNGWEFRREQLQDTTLAGIPTILITAHSRADENTTELKASGFLRKPAQPNTLLETVGRYCH
ncbi:MAG TPA: response regulator [Thermoanaerobaculia bacterium]|nr:response regulator [Thermoanaerobaculia bacterium]